MSQTLTIRQEGDTFSTTIPRDVADALQLGDGDKLYLVPTDKGFLLTAEDPRADDAAYQAAMRSFARVREKYRNTLRELAK
jgi:putative addiction module antidote